MGLDHAAIFKAYENAATIDDSKGVFDENGDPITIEQSKIDEARITLNAEAVATKYQTDRTDNGSTRYASFGDQLDMLYKDIVAGKLDTTGTWASHIKAVKDANPKP